MIEKITYECSGCFDTCVVTMPSDNEHPLYCPCDMNYDTDWHEVEKLIEMEPLPEGYLKNVAT